MQEKVFYNVFYFGKLYRKINNDNEIVEPDAIYSTPNEKGLHFLRGRDYFPMGTEFFNPIPRLSVWCQVQEIQYNLGKYCRLQNVTHPAYEFYHMLRTLREMNKS